MDEVYKLGQKVDLIILKETDLGYVARINDVHEGLLYHDEIFERLELGQVVTGFIKKVRPDGGIDLLLQAFGNFGTEELAAKLLEILKDNQGFIPVNAKSPAEQIYNISGVSRKKFKMAIGHLYKKRLIKFTDNGTKLITDKIQ